jgi:hypothetical protein
MRFVAGKEEMVACATGFITLTGLAIGRRGTAPSSSLQDCPLPFDRPLAPFSLAYPHWLLVLWLDRGWRLL